MSAASSNFGRTVGGNDGVVGYRRLSTAAMTVAIMTTVAGCGAPSGKDTGPATAVNTIHATHAKNVRSSGAAHQNNTTLSTNVSGNVNDSTNSSSGSAAPTKGPVNYGWYYNNLSIFGPDAQIVALKPSNGSLDVEAEYDVTQGTVLQPNYKSAAVNLNHGTFGSAHSSVQPSGYSGTWSLKFGMLQYTKPIQISLAHNGTSVFMLPWSLPGYASEIMTNPAKFDNQVIGRSGSWVWIAMKGPQTPPIPQMINGFRYWNRIVAINTQSHVFYVYSIPPNTSATSTESNAPAFTQIGQTVYIGTGPWIGAFPAQPTDNNQYIVRPEPQSVVSQDEQKMLSMLKKEVTIGADGLANYWNGYVMKGKQQDSKMVWEMDPAFWNHGYLPEGIDWAARFPLNPGSYADETRQQLFGEISVLLNNPLDEAWVALDTPQKIKEHFNASPPAAIPGYVVRGGYYREVGRPVGTSTSSQQTVYVFSQAMLEEIYAVLYFRQVGPIIPTQTTQNEVNKWAPKVSMAMLQYAPADEQALDKQLIQNIQGSLETAPKMSLLQSLPGYTLHHAQLPSGTRTYWYPTNNKFPDWVDPAVFGAAAQGQGQSQVTTAPIHYTQTELGQIKQTAQTVGVAASIPYQGMPGDVLTIVKNGGKGNLILDYKNIWVIESTSPIGQPTDITTQSSVTVDGHAAMYMVGGQNSFLSFQSRSTYITIENLTPGNPISQQNMQTIGASFRTVQ